MPDETLHDLMVQVGLRSTRPRPLPQSMRPAWETTPEANQPLRTPQQALSDPRTVPYEQRPTQRQTQQDRELQRFARMHELNRNDVNTPPGTYFGQDTLEMTGAPALSRGMDALAAGNPGRALPEVAMGGASILGWGFGAHPASRAPLRAPMRPMEPPPRLPNAPPRLPGRATDGSVLPIRPPEPIRQSLVGGSDDLAEAARMRPRTPPRAPQSLTQTESELRDFLVAQRRPMTDEEIAAAWPRAEGSPAFVAALRNKLEVKGQTPDFRAGQFNSFDEGEAARALAQRPEMDRLRATARAMSPQALSDADYNALSEQVLAVRRANGDVQSLLNDIARRYHPDVAEEVALRIDAGYGSPNLQSLPGGRSAPPRINEVPDDMRHTRYWVERYGGGPDGEAKALRDYRADLAEAQRWPENVRQRRIDELEQQIRWIESGEYRRAAPNNLSARVEAAFPELYRAPDAPNASTPRAPIDVFHGARQPVEGSLRPGRDGVVWSTDNPNAASYLSGRRGGDGANVIPGRVTPEGYAVHDSGGQTLNPMERQRILDEARAAGHRGVVFRNDVDGVAGGPSTNIASFDGGDFGPRTPPRPRPPRRPTQ